MSKHIEFMESSFMEQLEFEQSPKTSQYDESIGPNYTQAEEVEGELVEEQNLQNETVAEQSLEEENSTIKYQEVDALVRHEIKEAVFKKETEKVSLAVLSEKKDIILEKINSLQVLRDEVGQETEELNIKAEVDKVELQQLQKQMQHNAEILEKLGECMKTINDGYKYLQSRNQELTGKTAEQKTTVTDFKNDWERKISELKSDVKNKKTSSENVNDADPIKEHNLRLKAILLEKKERLKEVQKQCREIEIKKEKSNVVRNKKQELQHTLKGLKEKLQELKIKKIEKENKLQERTKQLDLKVAEKRNRLSQSLQTAIDLKNKLKEKNEEKEQTRSVLVSMEKRNAQVERERRNSLAKLEECRVDFEAKSKKWQKEIQMSHDKVKQSEDKLNAIDKENEELVGCLEHLKAQYLVKVEERSETLLLKLELEEKLRVDAVLLEKKKLLDEKIREEQRATDELTQTIGSLSSDKRLVEMEKDKAYLTSTTDYLTVKFENFKKQLDELNLEVKTMEELVNSDKAIIQEKQKVRDNLLKEIQELREDVDPEEPQRPPPGILKSPLKHKTFSTSPKKVKFEGLSSCESSASSDLQTGRQQTIAGKSVDEILQQINAENFKQPTKLSRKRKNDSN